MNDILVGRDDGTVEVYGFDSSSEPTLRFEHVSLCLTQHTFYLLKFPPIANAANSTEITIYYVVCSDRFKYIYLPTCFLDANSLSVSFHC